MLGAVLIYHRDGQFQSLSAFLEYHDRQYSSTGSMITRLPANSSDAEDALSLRKHQSKKHLAVKVSHIYAFGITFSDR